ncbi:MAG: amylo-alpha-1,6-glucosidase [Acidobacteriota bacterium]
MVRRRCLSDTTRTITDSQGRESLAETEWLEADGLGGFAAGTAGLARTRRYHALLLTATAPPAGRMVLVNGLEAWVETPAGRLPFSSQVYLPDVVSPDGLARLEAFQSDPWPRWTFCLEDGTRVEQEIFVSRRTAECVLTWRLCPGASSQARLSIRPLVSGRDYHALHHENPGFRFDPEIRGETVAWRPYEGVPGIAASHNGRYEHEPLWYRNFLYREEQARGLDCAEDLAAPGVFHYDLSRGEAILILGALPYGAAAPAPAGDAAGRARTLRAEEKRRRLAYPSILHRAVDDYVVPRGSGRTILAGYPWFTDWGRDTFIALRGLCLATGRLDDAREILLGWSDAVSEGMLPNRFPDRGDEPEFNAVDASLWYVVAARDYLAARKSSGRPASEHEREKLARAIGEILTGYERGTRYDIRADSDGLLAAGVPGVQLTWMDARVGDRVVTPRIGKPVEVQALWINALKVGGAFDRRFLALAEIASASFGRRFWNEEAGALYDVVDVDHVPGTADPTFRPNQIFAVGGLPYPVLEGERARRVVDAVERKLWTPLGLRSLAPGEPSYTGRYEGGPASRDGAYHQGTVWPWLTGAFVEAWLRVRGGGAAARREARERFLAPLQAHLSEAGLGHVSEIADADPPHRPRGCPFQAWSVGEALRLELQILAEPKTTVLSEPARPPAGPAGLRLAR